MVLNAFVGSSSFNRAVRLQSGLAARTASGWVVQQRNHTRAHLPRLALRRFLVMLSAPCHCKVAVVEVGRGT